MSYDNDLAEIHDEMYRDEEERVRGGFSGLDQTTKFWVGVAFAGIILSILFNKLTLTQGAIMLAVGGMVLMMMQGDSGKRSELTYIECLIRINDQLKFLQMNQISDKPQIPPGKIHVLPVGKKQWYEGIAFKRSYGVDIFDEDQGTTDSFFVEVDVFTGDIITFKIQPEGVTGDEKKDIKLMPTPDMRWEKRKDDYLGNSKNKF